MIQGVAVKRQTSEKSKLMILGQQ